MNLKDRVIYTWAQLFGRNRFYKLNFLLMRLGLSGMGVLNYQDYNISGEQAFKEYLLKNFTLKTVFDVGCNEGNYITPFVNANANINIHCFEPVPQTCQRLKKRYATDKNIVVNQLGLSDQKQETFIYDYVGVGGSSHASLFEENISKTQNQRAEKTAILLDSLDNYIAENNIENIDLMKIDTEGNEIFVLKGAKAALSSGKINVIQFEFSHLNIVSKSFFRDFIEILSDYNLYRLLPNGFFPLNFEQQALIYEQYAFQNVVAFRKEIDKLSSNSPA